MGLYNFLKVWFLCQFLATVVDSDQIGEEKSTIEELLEINIHGVNDTSAKELIIWMHDSNLLNKEHAKNEKKMFELLNALKNYKLEGLSSNSTDDESQNYFKRPRNCADLYVSGIREDGIYTIYPFRCYCSRPVTVYCDMTTNGGGWTTVLVRKEMTEQISFNRTWEEFAEGFGQPDGEYWIGNQNLHLLTTSEDQTLRIEIADFPGFSYEKEIEGFSISSEENKFKLLMKEKSYGEDTIENYLLHLSGTPFGTFDKIESSNCTKNLGAWWYTDCSPAYHLEDRYYDRYTKLNYFDYMLPLTGYYHNDLGVEVSFPWYRLNKRYAKEIYLKIRPQICDGKTSNIRLNPESGICDS